MPIAKPLNPNRTPETRQKMKSSRAVFMNHDPTCCKTTCNQVTSWATAQRDSHWPICHKSSKDTVQMLRVEKPAKSLIKSPSMFQKLHMSHHFPSLSSSFPALQVHPPWVRCLESNPKMLSKGWSRYGYMALQGDWLAISNQDAHRIRRQTGNTPSMLAYCARRVHNLKSWKRMDNLEWLVPPNHHMKVPLVWLDPCKS